MTRYPWIDAFRFTPAPAGQTAVQSYLGLAPADADTGKAKGLMPDELRQQNQSDVATKLAQALMKFRAATVEVRVYDEEADSEKYPTCKDCDAQLYQAMDLLRMIRDLDPDARATGTAAGARPSPTGPAAFRAAVSHPRL